MKYLWLVIIALISSSISAETVKLCSAERDTLSNKNGTGYYWDLIRAAYGAQGKQVIDYSATFDQCLSIVDSMRLDGAIGAFKTPDRAIKYSYPQHRLHYSSYGIVSLKQTVFNQIQNLDGPVGLIKGYDFSAWLPSSLDVYSVDNTHQAIKMLKLKRLKFHADDIQDVLLSLRKMGESPDNYIMKPFHKRDLYILFTKDQRGEELADMFDKGLNKIFENGEMKQIVEKYALTNSILEDFR